MQTDTGPLAYSIKETCQRSSLGKTRVYQLINAGQLRAIRVGRRTLVSAESLQSLLNSGC